MKSVRKMVVGVGAGALLLAASQANAFQLNLGGGIGLVDLNAIDWDANGSAYIQGFQPVANDNFSITAISQATKLTNLGVESAGMLDTFAVSPALSFSTVELTLVASLNESVQSVVGNIANFIVLGGRFDIYLDFSPEVNNLQTGLGFSDGIRILGGVFNAGQTGSFTDLNLIPPGSPGADGTGSNNLDAVIDFVNATWFTPDPTSSNATTTLQFGQSAAGWVRPTSIDGAAIGPDTPSDFVMQADANQFFAVPEPGSLALLGIAMTGLGLARRRKVA